MFTLADNRKRKDKVSPHVGYNHRVYSIRSESSADIKYCFQWRERCKLESLIEIYLRDGNTIGDQSEISSGPVSIELERVRQRVIESYDVYQNKSHDQFVNKLSIVECSYKGPIFVKLKGDKQHRECLQAVNDVTKSSGSINYKVWVDADGCEVNLTYESWTDICKTFFVGAGVPDATTHSIRKSAAVWAARCGAEEYQIREAGRWNSGDTYTVYVKSGKVVADLAASRKNGSIDPIRKIWVFHPTVLKIYKTIYFKELIKFSSFAS